MSGFQYDLNIIRKWLIAFLGHRVYKAANVE